MLFKDINWYLMCQSFDVKKRRVASHHGTHYYHWVSNRARRIACNVNLISYFVIYKVSPIYLSFCTCNVTSTSCLHFEEM